MGVTCCNEEPRGLIDNQEMQRSRTTLLQRNDRRNLRKNGVERKRNGNNKIKIGVKW